MDRPYQGRGRAVSVSCALAVLAGAAHAQTPDKEEYVHTLAPVVVTAEEQIKQAPGVSIVTSEQIENTPITNDISEIIRRQPGVNLTGNTSTGARGNNRQIDIRGMGPENTLILIDGKPVLSRNSVRYGVGGERDTRGDSNWVPAEAIESIEVLRGPAAARYGSGAAGGVVNIRTKAATERTMSFSAFTNIPEDSKEGDTRRFNILASGPVNDVLSYRFFGNFAVTDNDDIGINGTPTFDGRAYNMYAGREGVKNRDLGGRLSFRLNPDHRVDLDTSWSRQSNKFAGDSLISYVFPDANNPDQIDNSYASLVGKETNRMTRSNVSLTHFGTYSFGHSESYIQFERTENRRLGEGLAGAGEGAIETGDNMHWNKSTLNNINAKSEFHIPLNLGGDQVLTMGVEFRRESMNDPGSIVQDLPDGLSFGGVPINASDRTTRINSRLLGFYLENNIYLSDDLVVTPGVRFDHHSEFGGNTSPSLNASWQATPEISFKGGIARAFKAPNLYQLNPNYVYNSRGYGCWQLVGPCNIIGNPDLDPEISLNKEIGIAFENDAGWIAGITYFHNRYKNRISAGHTVVASVEEQQCWWGQCQQVNNLLQRWENSGPATIAGIEGNLTIPLARSLEWSNNFTYMSKSEDDQGQPLSLVPKYTINSWLNWSATEKLKLNLGVTHYGKIEARQAELMTGEPIALSEERSAYTLVNFGANYRFNKTIRVNAGVKNLFDKKLQRTGVGANTFNEPGRSFYVGLNATF